MHPRPVRVPISLTHAHTISTQPRSDSAQQVAAELHKLQGELAVRLPYRRGALARAADKSLASIKAGAVAASAAAAAASASAGGGGGPAGVVPAEGTRKPDEAFEGQ